jgi:hypothetical protein
VLVGIQYVTVYIMRKIQRGYLTTFLIALLRQQLDCTFGLTFVPIHKDVTSTNILRSFSHPLFYRDDKTLISDEILIHSSTAIGSSMEASLSTIPTTSESNTSHKQFQHSNVPSTIDSTTIAYIILSHFVLLLLSTFGFALLNLIMPYMIPMDDTATLWQSPNTLLETWDQVLLLGCGGAVPLIYLSHDIPNAIFNTTNEYGTAIYRHQVDVAHMVLQMLGQRRQHLVTPSPNTQIAADISSNTSTGSSIFVLSIVTVITSTSAEFLYRYCIPMILYSITSSYTISIFVSSILYGLSHIQWDSRIIGTKVISNSRMVFTQQTLAGIWYSMICLCSGGNIAPAIIVHYMYDMDLLTSTWHRINNQLDYVDLVQQQQQQVPTNMVVHSPSIPTLTNEAVEVSRRFFYAFDSEHVGSLSEKDVYHATQYILYKQNKNHHHPYQYHEISRKFHQYARIQINGQTNDVYRLDYSGFVLLIHDIYHDQRTDTTSTVMKL